jgi:AcrR family transcriptional regulator
MEPPLELPGSNDVPTRLVEATIRLLAEEGPSAIKARTVASASGLSTMVVYSHFGGIPELLNAVIDEGFKQLATAFSQVPVTDDPLADLCSMALTTRQKAHDNPHLYDLMFGLSKRATYRPLKDHGKSFSGGSAAFLAAYDHVVAACARLVESGRVGDHDPKAMAGQLWSIVHGFVTLELSDHFADFDDPVASVLLRLGTNLAVGLGDDVARAQASHELAAKTHTMIRGSHVRGNREVIGPGHEKERDE